METARRTRPVYRLPAVGTELNAERQWRPCGRPLQPPCARPRRDRTKCRKAMETNARKRDARELFSRVGTELNAERQWRPVQVIRNLLKDLIV